MCGSPRAEGQSCGHDDECLGELSCIVEVCSEGKQGEDAGCIRSEDCDNKHVCFENKCEPKADEGEECGEDEHCMEGLKCVEGQGEMPDKTCRNADGSGSASSESSAEAAVGSSSTDETPPDGGDPSDGSTDDAGDGGLRDTSGSVDDAISDSGSDPDSESGSSGLGPEYAPYQKKLKVGVPEGAIRRDMIAAGIDPEPLFGGESGSNPFGFKSLRGGDPFESSYSATEDKLAKAEERYQQLFGAV